MQQLLNPFAQKYPEAVDCTLSSQATSVRFNPSGPYAGHYLAAGGSDGLVEVWDVETRGIVRQLEGHVKAVGGLSWSRNNRFLLSTSLDGTAIVWDLAALSPLLRPLVRAAWPRSRTLRFDAPLSTGAFHPRNAGLILVTLTCNEVVLVDLRGYGPSEAGRRWVLVDAMEGDEEEEGAKKKALTCAAWSPCGSRIYAGTNGGMVLVIDPVSRLVQSRIKVGTSGIKQLALDGAGRNLILNSTDRALRVLTVSPQTGALAPIHRFQDLVNRTAWHAVGFSGDGEYVFGGAGHKMSHNVFVWDREAGALVKVLEGPKESLMDADWHPTRPIIATVENSGDVHIWQTSSPDNWAAFAPGFEELEENVEYDEHEDEFDIEDEDDAARKMNEAEDEDIDVLSPADDFPRRPEPSLGAAGAAEHDEEDEAARAARLVRAATEWADAQPDHDSWEGFYLSIDLLEEPIENE
ncbi:hypothetical protein CspHIS471_0408200 [Cutaneotrichosporon sp. HIS471]|nr:hypothetical protein CspHIS471_0408200 [Cutaneotrichosporon sp. HIS471]